MASNEICVLVESSPSSGPQDPIWSPHQLSIPTYTGTYIPLGWIVNYLVLKIHLDLDQEAGPASLRPTVSEDFRATC